MIVPEELMNHAKRIIMQENSPQEAEFRSAVSRAYYSVYHEARIGMFTKYKKDMSDAICWQLDKRKKPYDKSKIYALDLEYIKKQGVNWHMIIPSVLIRIGKKGTSNDLRAFRDDRNEADYDIHIQYPMESARAKVEGMERLALEIQQI